MGNPSYWVWGYAILLVLGGVIGFVKAGSVVSIVMSATFAGLLTWSGWLLWKDSLLGYRATLTLLGILLAIFSWRFYNSFKPVPGVIGLATLLLLIILLMSSTPKDS